MKTYMNKTVITAAAVLLLSTQGHAAVGSDQIYERWQLKRLFTPTEKQVEQETKGKVFIYENMKDRDVDRVMSEQFDRVEAMMFVGTVITDKQGKPKKDPVTGNAVKEDDGC